MNREFVRKLIQAKKMEQEAFLELIPERTRGHLQAIEREMKAMLMECFLESNGEEKKRGTVKKVDIG